MQTTLNGINGTLTSYVSIIDRHTQDIITVKTTLDGMSGTLENEVSKGDVVSVINQSAGAVKISAACID